MRCLLLLAFCLFLTACQSVPQNPETSKLTMADIGQTKPGQSRPWEFFIFDIQVESQGRILPQEHEYKLAEKSPGRLLIRASSIGSDNRERSLQGSTGLWPDPTLQRAHAKLYIDIGWPLTDNPVPDTVFNAHISSARLVCEEWAQGLETKKSDANSMEKLNAAMKKNFTNITVPARFINEPYKLGDTWILPVLVTLPQDGFAANCL